MKSNILRTAKHTLIYGVGNLSGKLIGFILLPVYTTYLSTADYGILAILEATSQILVAVLGFRLATAIMRWYSDQDDIKKQKEIVFTVFIALIFLLILFLSFSLPFTKSLAILFFNNPSFNDYFFVLFFSITFEILNDIPLTLLRIRERSLFYIVITSAKLLIILFLNIYFIVLLNLGVLGIILSQLIGNIALIAFTVPYLLKSMVFRFDWIIFKQMFKYSFPLIFATFSSMFLALGDRYILKLYLPYSQIGIYALGYKIASFINAFIINSFQLGFLPIAFKMCDKDEAKYFFAKTLTYFTYILVFVALILSFFAREIIELVAQNKEYHQAFTIVPFITFAFVLKGMQYIFSIGLHCVKKTQYNAFIVISAAILHLIINLVLIPQLGIYGAAITTIISASLMILLYYYFSQKLYYVDYELRKITKILLVSIILYFLSTMSIYMGLLIGVGFKILLLFIFPVGLYFLKFYDKNEIQQIRNLWERLLSFRIN